MHIRSMPHEHFSQGREVVQALWGDLLLVGQPLDADQPSLAARSQIQDGACAVARSGAKLRGATLFAQDHQQS